MYNKIFIHDIISQFSNDIISVEGDVGNVFVTNIKDYKDVDVETLDWINPLKPNNYQMALQSKAKVLLCNMSVKYTSELRNENKVLIYVNNPKLLLSKIANFYFLEKPKAQIHPSAIIDNDAKIDKSVSIGAGCVIGKAIIKKDTIIFPNVTIYDGTIIGENCIIQAGSVIGTDGLGCQRDKNGILIKFPHFAGVQIGNNVEIGANCQIAKGALTDTIIGSGCKINGLSFIAHNCILEENVWITGNTMLAGSVRVKKNTTIFSNVIVRDQRTIGEHVVIGMGSVVTKDIPNGETWIGNPAKIIEK